MDAVEETVRLVALVRGQVQGVGFRFWVRSHALDLRLRGWVRNVPDGRVELVAEGTRGRCDALLAELRTPEAPGRVDAIGERFEAPLGDLEGFVTR